MFLRIDRLQVELPMPDEPDPNAAAAVQELLGGRFGEMSTLMNYTYQSFNFRGREAARPFYELISNIAAEELGHIELVAHTINAMLTGAVPDDGAPPAAPLSGLAGVRNTHHFLNNGASALVANSMGQPWQGDFVFNSGDLVLDLLHNFFLECGARAGKRSAHAGLAVGGAGEHRVDRRRDELDVAELLGRDAGHQVVERPRALPVAEVERLVRVVHEGRHLAVLAAEQRLDDRCPGRVGI